MPRAYRRIRDYGLIGNTFTAALVDRFGSIDWFCQPRFDSPALFCRLLDEQKGGFLAVHPSGDFTSTRCYRGDSSVLDTTFECSGGRARLTDLMPIAPLSAPGPDPHSGRPRIVRRIEALAGNPELEVEFRPTFDYARAPAADVEFTPAGLVARAVGDAAALACPVRLSPSPDGAWRARFRLAAGATPVWLALTSGYGLLADSSVWPTADRCEQQLQQTLAYWDDWSGRCRYEGLYTREVRRSALTLKLLTYEPTGALVAAPTTSLPERLGGERNWDYRFAWLRDSALILHALQSVGYEQEARSFFHFLEGQCISCFGDLQLLYGIDGNPEIEEVQLDNLDGYAGSRPVRIGNAAAQQRQIDTYGEVLDAADLYAERMGALEREMWEVVEVMGNRAADRWGEPDEGIWEWRKGRRHFLHSKVMCWVALDRALRLSRFGPTGLDTRHWMRARSQVRDAILSQGFDTDLQAFVQSFEVRELDASVLMMPLVGFLPATDPRMLSTVRRIRDQLCADGLVYRYRTPDGLSAGEGAFALCSFWLIDNLAMSGHVEEAQHNYEAMLTRANDLGLYAEEFDSATGEMLGNFPQGFTHLGLIHSALSIGRAQRLGPEHQPHTLAQREEVQPRT